MGKRYESEGKNMKNAYKLLGLMLVFALTAIPAYGAMETAGGAVTPTMTFEDFQRDYSGTKPIVATLKFHEYQWLLQYAPRPTLLISRMREEPAAASTLGTKPVVGILKTSEIKGKELGPIRVTDYDSAAGTKPAVKALKSGRG